MKRILFVQNGDYREAWRRFAAGGPETYRDQRASVDFVAGLAPAARVETLAFGPESYREELAPGLWAAGLPHDRLEDSAAIAGIFDAARPSHVILRTPHAGFLREATRRGAWVLPVFADIFTPGRLRGRLRNRRLRRALLAARAPCFSNHSLNASRSLAAALGLPPARIVPWDWSRVPLGGPAKAGVADPARPTAFFAGSLSARKGVDECLGAVAALARAGGPALSMTFAGPGDAAPWIARAEALGIAERVVFAGRIANAEVRRQMRGHDFVVVPSRHDYPEGLPNTIYEGLAARSALVISDHPAFAGRLAPDAECLVFPAGDPEALAACLRRATADAALYRRLSENAAAAHDRLYVGMEWSALVTAFLDDPDNRRGWVAANALSTLAPGPGA